MSIREIVYKHLAAVVTENSPVECPETIADDDRLEDFWLDSVAFSELLSRIEKDVGYIPAPILEGEFYPETFGELVVSYDNQ